MQLHYQEVCGQLNWVQQILTKVANVFKCQKIPNSTSTMHHPQNIGSPQLW